MVNQLEPKNKQVIWGWYRLEMCKKGVTGTTGGRVKIEKWVKGGSTEEAL